MKCLLLLVWIAATVPLSGCNPLAPLALWPGPTLPVPLNPTPPTDQLSNVRLPYTLGLHFTDEFTSYRRERMSKAEMSMLNYDLGRASRSLFLETFMQVSNAVVLVPHRPPFRPEDRVDATLIVEPAILAFGEDYPILVRAARYAAYIEYKLVVLDRAGNILLDKVVRAEGEYQGRATHSPGSNYAAAAEAAMRSAIVSIVNEVVRLEVPAKVEAGIPSGRPGTSEWPSTSDNEAP